MTKRKRVNNKNNNSKNKKNNNNQKKKKAVKSESDIICDRLKSKAYELSLINTIHKDQANKNDNDNDNDNDNNTNNKNLDEVIDRSASEWDHLNNAAVENKSITRARKQYIIIIPGRLDIESKGGRFGEINDLHTPNPYLYVELPNGRIKLFGTFIHTNKTKYLPMLYKTKGGNDKRPNMKVGKDIVLTSRGVFDQLLVFSEYEFDDSWRPADAKTKDEEEDIGDDNKHEDDNKSANKRKQDEVNNDNGKKEDLEKTTNVDDDRDFVVIE